MNAGLEDAIASAKGDESRGKGWIDKKKEDPEFQKGFERERQKLAASE